jgi:hypothetical protein
MVGVAARLHTPVYLQHRNAGGFPVFVSILAASSSTTISHYSSEEQHHRGSISISVYSTCNVEANYSTIYS